MNTANRILHIINIPWYSGLARYAIDMADFMGKLSGDPLVACAGGSVLAEKISGRFNIIELPGRKPLESLKGIFTLADRRYDYDLIVAHTGTSLFMAAALSALRGCPFIRVRAQAGSIKKNPFNRIVHKRAGLIIAPSRVIFDDVERLVGSKESIFYLPPLVDTGIFRYSDLPPDSIISVMGRLDKVKGHEVLIRSLARIKQEIPDIRVIVAGSPEGVKWEDLHGLARELKVDDTLDYRGGVSDSDVARIMSMSRIGVIPSLGSEAVSRVALEWMASGRPVIASAVGIFPEIIRPGDNGFIVPPNNSDELAQSVIALLKNRALNDKMGKRAYYFISEKFSPEVYSANIKRILELVNE